MYTELCFTKNLNIFYMYLENFLVYMLLTYLAPESSLHIRKSTTGIYFFLVQTTWMTVKGGQ